MSVAANRRAGWETVVGLEVHCRLRTRTKLFCGCLNRFGEAPNTCCCAVCSGQPGALPVLNREAVRLAVRAALGLGAEVQETSRFDRKHYFYCDLPKGFQITQFAAPYARGGGIRLASGKLVRLARIHIEEDAGKALHAPGRSTRIDLNRAGAPLIESVTEPDLASGAEALEYLTALREILRYVGASDGDMEKGSLRCDVNVSVRRPNGALRTKVELKNLNSFRSVRAAVEYEAARQIEAYEAGDPSGYPTQETRLYDAERGETRPMRSKEDAADYRYFPEPDLPPVELDALEVERERESLPELPRARRERYCGALGLSAYDAGVLTADRERADFFEAVVARGATPKDAANWISNELLRWTAERHAGRSLADLPLTPKALAELISLVRTDRLPTPSARRVLGHLLEHGGNPSQVVADLDLEPVAGRGPLVRWCRAALAAEPEVVAAVRAGRTQALDALIGVVMRTSAGRADPKEVRALLLELLTKEAARPEEGRGEEEPAG